MYLLDLLDNLVYFQMSSFGFKSDLTGPSKSKVSCFSEQLLGHLPPLRSLGIWKGCFPADAPICKGQRGA